MSIWRGGRIAAASALVVGLLAGASGAQSLMKGHVLTRASASIIDVPQAQPLLQPRSGGGIAIGGTDAQAGAARDGSSLFAGAARGLFAPLISPQVLSNIAPITHDGVVGLRQLIASIEAGRKDYYAVQYGARIKPPLPPTRMTIGQIYQWIAATPGQQHAIGRYQFIPSTLRRVVAEVGLSEDTPFTPEVQDRLADVLLEDAGLSRFMRGELSQKSFMKNLGKIWAGFPDADGTSHYEGVAGNKAVISWDRFEAQIERIFPRG